MGGHLQNITGVGGNKRRRDPNTSSYPTHRLDRSTPTDSIYRMAAQLCCKSTIEFAALPCHGAAINCQLCCAHLHMHMHQQQNPQDDLCSFSFVCYLFFFIQSGQRRDTTLFVVTLYSDLFLFSGDEILLQLGCLFLVGISGCDRSHGHLE